MPLLAIIENVPRFPLGLLSSHLGDLYDVDHTIIDAECLGSPARRKRLYAVLTLRGKTILTKPLEDFSRMVKETFRARLSWDVLFCLDGADDGFSMPVQKRAREYMRVFKNQEGVYDLDQLPRGRPRRARAGCSLCGLIAHTRNVWSPAEGRTLRRSELAAAMGIPAHTALASTYGIQPLEFDRLSRSAAARLIGNGMSVPCVGAIMA